MSQSSLYSRPPSDFQSEDSIIAGPRGSLPNGLADVHLCMTTQQPRNRFPTSPCFTQARCSSLPIVYHIMQADVPRNQPGLFTNGRTERVGRLGVRCWRQVNFSNIRAGTPDDPRWPALELHRYSLPPGWRQLQWAVIRPASPGRCSCGKWTTAAGWMAPFPSAGLSGGSPSRLEFACAGHFW